MRNIPRIAAIQMCSSHSVEENLLAAAGLIAIAAKNKAQLMVLPEMFAIMGKKPTDKVDAREAFGCGKIQDFLSQQAKMYKTWIVGGTIPIACDDDRKVRAAPLLSMITMEMLLHDTTKYIYLMLPFLKLKGIANQIRQNLVAVSLLSTHLLEN